MRRSAQVVAALAPAVVLAGAGVWLNRFTLIDDGVTLVTSLYGGPLSAFTVPDTGRYVPFYFMLPWLMMWVLPPQPWSFSLVNGLFLVVGAWQVALMARRLAGPWAAVAAAWMFGLGLTTVENVFTLGKAEPKQLVFWLGVLLLLGRTMRDVDNSPMPLETPLMLACAAAAVLFKETAVLLWPPLFFVAILTWRERRALDPRHVRRRVRLLVAAAIPLGVTTVMVLAHGMRQGSYARERVVGSSPLLGLLDPRLPTHDALLATLLVSGLLGGVFLIARRDEAAFAGLLLLQLGAIVAFFAAIRASMLYYYLPAVALAAVLLSAALFAATTGHALWRVAAGTVIVFLVACGASRTLAGAWGLAGWSRLYDRLTAAVVTARPPRVLFHRAGSEETLFEARLVWDGLHKVPVRVGTLDGGPALEADAFTRRDLRAGDWIMEQFGSLANEAIPFRDMNATRPVEHALIDPAGRARLPVRLVRAYRSEFPVPPQALTPRWSDWAHIEWRIYEVAETPHVVVEGLDDDDWMGGSARLWIHGDQREPVTLRFTPFVHPGSGVYDNELLVYAGETLVTRCAAARHAVLSCTVDPARGQRDAAGTGWSRWDLRAAKTFSPKALGVSADPRSLSFNFAATWDGRSDPAGAPRESPAAVGAARR